MSRRIVRAKLAVPTLPDARVDRPRLDDRIAALLDRDRIVVVSATAGSGKTTAVAAAIRRLDVPVAWLTLDRSDTAPGRLLTYLEAALARVAPDIVGTATRALSVGVPHAEAAGILAEALRGHRAVFVLDELERLGDVRPAWNVIETLLRYAPEGLSFVLISRRAIPFKALPAPAAAAAIVDAELAFTAAEAAQALQLHGEAPTDEQAVVDATGGWVTGVLFESWRWAGDLAEAGGAVDPLHGYLAAHIVGELDPADREFLQTTAVLTEVSAPRAEALGIPDAAARLAALHDVRLPVTWSEGGTVMRCHPRFREYLLMTLEERGERDVAQLHLALGRRLVEEGFDEEATEALLRAHAPEEALAPAERAIAGVVERLDIPIAERWLRELRELCPASAALDDRRAVDRRRQRGLRARRGDRRAAGGARPARGGDGRGAARRRADGVVQPHARPAGRVPDPRRRRAAGPRSRCPAVRGRSPGARPAAAAPVADRQPARRARRRQRLLLRALRPGERRPPAVGLDRRHHRRTDADRRAARPRADAACARAVRGGARATAAERAARPDGPDRAAARRGPRRGGARGGRAAARARPRLRRSAAADGHRDHRRQGGAAARPRPSRPPAACSTTPTGSPPRARTRS